VLKEVGRRRGGEEVGRRLRKKVWRGGGPSAKEEGVAGQRGAGEGGCGRAAAGGSQEVGGGRLPAARRRLGEGGEGSAAGKELRWPADPERGRWWGIGDGEEAGRGGRHRRWKPCGSSLGGTSGFVGFLSGSGKVGQIR
jgi:hypothetical protein